MRNHRCSRRERDAPPPSPSPSPASAEGASPARRAEADDGGGGARHPPDGQSGGHSRDPPCHDGDANGGAVRRPPGGGVPTTPRGGDDGSGMWRRRCRSRRFRGGKIVRANPMVAIALLLCRSCWTRWHRTPSSWPSSSITFLVANAERSHEHEGAHDGGKFLYGTDNEASRPVLEYMLHLAPSSDYEEVSGTSADHLDGFEEAVRNAHLQRQRDKVGGGGGDGGATTTDNDLSHVRPYFLRPDHGPNDVTPRVVEFYSPWCGHCREFKSRYVALAREVNSRLSSTTATTGTAERVDFHAVSCSEYHEVCRSYGIDGFPTVLAFKAGRTGADGGERLTRFTPELIASAVGVSLDGGGAAAASSAAAADAATGDVLNSITARQPERGNGNVIDILGASREAMSRTRHDTYVDAALSLTHLLRTAVYPANSPGVHVPASSGPLAPEGGRREALREFLDLLYWTLPPTWRGVHALVHDLRTHFDDQVVLGRDNLIHFLDLHDSVVHEALPGDFDEGGEDEDQDGRSPTRERRWTKSCNRRSVRGVGYTCGLWNLLHIVSVGVNERHRAVLGNLERVSTRHAASTMRDFAHHFLGGQNQCQVCRDAFVGFYDSCAHGVCDRVADHHHHRPAEKDKKRKTKKKGTDAVDPKEAWKELALWLWEVHNDVNVKILGEQLRATQEKGAPATPEQERAVRWPTVEACPECWKRTKGGGDDATKKNTGHQRNDVRDGASADAKDGAPFDEEAVYAFLRKEYWPAGVQNFRYVVLDRKKREKAKVEEAGWFEVLLTILPRLAVAVALVGYSAWYMNKRRLRRTGWHKKVESERHML